MLVGNANRKNMEATISGFVASCVFLRVGGVAL